MTLKLANSEGTLFKKRVQRYRGAEYAVRPVTELKVEMVVDPASIMPVMAIVHEFIDEGESHDRRAYVTDLEELRPPQGTHAAGSLPAF